MPRVRIRRQDRPDAPWSVYIAPSAPEHYDGDDILAPFGDTYWPTWQEAVDFALAVIAAPDPLTARF